MVCVHNFLGYLGHADGIRMRPEETIDFPIRRVWSRIARLYNTEAAKYGGSMAVGQILLNIEPQGTPSTKLGPKMGMESRSLVRTLQTMECEGLIRRTADASDKRVVRIHLTAKGKQMRDVSRNTVIRFNEAVQRRFTPAQLTNFRQVMSELDRILEQEQLF
jgi:DNA-binding MarR family transcriptional regulator